MSKRELVHCMSPRPISPVFPHAFCGPAGRYSAPGSTHPACCYLHMFPCIRTGRMAVSAVQPEWQCPCQRLHDLCPPTLCPRSASSLSRPCTPPFGRHRGTTQRTATGAARTTGSRTPSRRCRITVAFPDSSGKSASTAPSAVRSSSPPALATRPPGPHARTQAGRALGHPPPPLCCTRHPGPRRRSARFPPPPRLPMSTASSDALVPRPRTPLHPLAPSACTPSHRLAPLSPLQVRPTTCRASSVTTRRARRHRAQERLAPRRHVAAAQERGRTRWYLGAHPLARAREDRLADQMARMTRTARATPRTSNLSDLGGGATAASAASAGTGTAGTAGMAVGSSHGGHGYGGQGHGGHGGGPGPARRAPPLSAQAYVQPSPIEEESPRSGHSGKAASGAAHAGLQLLVEDGMRADDPAQDSMVEAILMRCRRPAALPHPDPPATLLGALQWTTLNPAYLAHPAVRPPLHPPLSRQTDVDSPQSAGALGRPLPGGDVMTLPASVLGGPSGRRPSPHRGASMSTSLAARKAHNAELAEAYRHRQAASSRCPPPPWGPTH